MTISHIGCSGSCFLGDPDELSEDHVFSTYVYFAPSLNVMFEAPPSIGSLALPELQYIVCPLLASSSSSDLSFLWRKHLLKRIEEVLFQPLRRIYEEERSVGDAASLHLPRV